MRCLSVALVVAAALMVPPTAQATAQNMPASLSLEGSVRHPQRWTLDSFRKLPSQRADVTFETERGPAKASFAGVLLWSLIAAAGGIADTGHGAAVRHAIRITASDGYVVVTSAGEIAPDIGGKAALIAYERDSKPLDNFFLVMPGDRKTRATSTMSPSSRSSDRRLRASPMRQVDQ